MVMIAVIASMSSIFSILSKLGGANFPANVAAVGTGRQAGFGGDYARTEVLPNNANFNRMDEILTLDVTEHVIR